MDIIEFKFDTYQYGPDDFESDVVDIFINGKDFMQTIRNFFNESYTSIRVMDMYDNLTKYYKDESEYGEDQFVFIYDCGCGCDGCDPFCVYIDVGEKVVTWYDFMTSEEYFDDVCKDNHFSMFKERMRTKGGLPPLVFDKKQYFKEVDALKKWSDNLYGNY